VQDRLDRSREHLRLLQRQRDDPDHGDRLRRVMSRLSRLEDSSAASASQYGDRVPSANSLYDWSPAADAGDDELDHMLDERVRSISTRLSSERAGGESLRSTAILQSVRRHPRFSARREYLSRYNTDRDRDASSRQTQTQTQTQHSESQARFMSESARQMALQRLAASENRSLDRERRDMLSRADSYRRSYLDHRSSSSPPAASPLLEQTVKYLSRIRHAETIDDSLNHALAAGFLSKDYFCMQYADFLTDTAAIPPPAETSWLAPGAVLSGCQHATSVAATVTATDSSQWRFYHASSGAALSTLPPPTRPWLANSYSTPRSRTSQLSPDPAPAPAQQDRWPVKVTMHAVDWAKMTLSATMEAYNVPSHPHPHQSLVSQQYTRTSSITTYLEGEILDFNQHTLLTESFKSTVANDAMYWRKLPPFCDLNEDEVVKALTSRKWYDSVLNKEYILMRWKERCFVKSLNTSAPPPASTTHTHNASDSPYRLVRDPATNALNVEMSTDTEHTTFDDSGCGLTISGFYYVCLRRSDGALQGLYFDPQSSPYQCLELESRQGGAVGAWEFR